MIHRLWRTLPHPIVCALGLLAVTLRWHVDVQQSPFYGCCTRRQILDRAERLCRLLVPQTGSLRLEVDHTIDGSLVPMWSVDASDDAGAEILNMAWNATAGDLSHVSFYSLPSRKPSTRIDANIFCCFFSGRATILPFDLDRSARLMVK